MDVRQPMSILPGIVAAVQEIDMFRPSDSREGVENTGPEKHFFWACAEANSVVRVVSVPESPGALMAAK